MIDKNTYTIIIPTMYYHNEELEIMLAKYQSNPYVKQILIINNCDIQKVDFNFNKVKTIGAGFNMFVNPSWRLGVSMAETERVVLVNDDIIIDGNLNELFEQVSNMDLSNFVIGADMHCFKSKGLFTGRVSIQKSQEITMTHGFGVFMFLTKESFRKVDIPTKIKVWYGDMIFYKTLNPYTFRGLEIITDFGGTTKKINLQGVAEEERSIYNQMKWQKN